MYLSLNTSLSLTVATFFMILMVPILGNAQTEERFVVDDIQSILSDFGESIDFEYRYQNAEDYTGNKDIHVVISDHYDGTFNLEQNEEGNMIPKSGRLSKGRYAYEVQQRRDGKYSVWKKDMFETAVREMAPEENEYENFNLLKKDSGIHFKYHDVSSQDSGVRRNLGKTSTYEKMQRRALQNNGKPWYSVKLWYTHASVQTLEEYDIDYIARSEIAISVLNTGYVNSNIELEAKLAGIGYEPDLDYATNSCMSKFHEQATNWTFDKIYDGKCRGTGFGHASELVGYSKQQCEDRCLDSGCDYISWGNNNCVTVVDFGGDVLSPNDGIEDGYGCYALSDAAREADFNVLIYLRGTDCPNYDLGFSIGSWSLVSLSHMNSYYTLAHEIGHGFGLNHSHGGGSPKGNCKNNDNYNCGWTIVCWNDLDGDYGLKTIMATNSFVIDEPDRPCALPVSDKDYSYGEAKVNYYSDPGVWIQWPYSTGQMYHTGEAGVAENARVFREAIAAGKGIHNFQGDECLAKPCAPGVCCHASDSAPFYTCSGSCPIVKQYVWKTGDFGPCSADCEGSRTREVYCIDYDTGDRVNNCECTQEARPLVEGSCGKATCDCHQPSPVTGMWGYGSWSSCSASCGVGVRTRDIVCFGDTSLISDDNCDCSTLDADIETCNSGPCPGDPVESDECDGYIPGTGPTNPVTDYCDGAPCGVNGTCVNGTNSYTCLCDDGFTGSQCQTSDTDSLNIRLEDGTTYSGRIEVFHDGMWGTVCDDSFGENEAIVVCRMLGFGEPENWDDSSATESADQNTPIWLDDLGCDGSESSLEDCYHRGWGVENCSHSEDVSITCNALDSSDECSNNPCGLNGTCINGANGDYECECDENYSGSNCETYTDPNNESSNSISFRIFATETECTGTFDKVYLNAHGSTPEQCMIKVLENDNCVRKDFFNQYPNGNCSCVGQNPQDCSLDSVHRSKGSGYTLYEIVTSVDTSSPVTDYCVDNPCGENGVCVNGASSYTCDCNSGFSGSQCQDADTTDACDEIECQNGGVCMDGACSCLNDYTGEHCEISPVSSNCEALEAENGLLSMDLAEVRNQLEDSNVEKENWKQRYLTLKLSFESLFESVEAEYPVRRRKLNTLELKSVEFDDGDLCKEFVQQYITATLAFDIVDTNHDSPSTVSNAEPSYSGAVASD